MPSVLLAGANGFVTVTILQALLNQGYNVVGTVRSESKIHYLHDKFSKFVDEEMLTFAVVQDITVPGAFDEVLKANKFDSVVHTSSPYHWNVTDARRGMLDPAIKGATGILESVRMLSPTVKRVVITAMFGNIMNIPKGDWPGKVYTEEDWNTITFDEQALSHPSMAYVSGKEGAERAAWDFVKETKPHFTIMFGPPEQELTSFNTSTADIYDVFNGTSEPRFTTWAWVDVQDLAQAHVLAIDAPAAANQRYLVTTGNYSAQAIADYIWEHYPERAVAKRDLGITYKHGFDTMLRDTLKKLEELEAEGK
ncbi:hypothetical protein M407DRAFT_19821 [Tulasnella calospora MUT 4182]|uniref:NAD-dependent epimerase/dehydratase domain-containing protein n=1 Tax=Tulasnella calospora MUT 4182 TaxID=1051891 RepID=A0A0C3MBS4_9AGAM|nr:hypothetical protein M407DRAFT_19821 [Tulasnella calospora MUT 4182]